MITSYQSKYFASLLTAKSTFNTIDRLNYALLESNVDLNPHQLEAALFAFRSPFSKGVMLADEVGLGKTIEAGLLLCQLYVERRRKLLIICPASLRTQWAMELDEKFNIPSIIIDRTSIKEYEKQGITGFQEDRAIIVSYNFATRLEAQLSLTNWDLCVLDEAHKLRNIYKPDNKIGKSIQKSLYGRKKLLLTATPLQNSLLEMYGLIHLIDENIFGTQEAFKENYINNEDFQALKGRLKNVVHRTLRKNVLEYVKYTNREAITMEFTPTSVEEQIYNAVSKFITQDSIYAVPPSQKQLLTLVIRKILSSSSFALVRTLQTIHNRLVLMKDGKSPDNSLSEIMLEHDISLDEEENEQEEVFSTPDKEIDQAILSDEIEKLEGFIKLAESIEYESKAYKLIEALKQGLDRMASVGANKKVIIFTESQRTQEYIINFLSQYDEYKDSIVGFNGQNKSKQATEIYKEWKDNNSNKSSKDVDTRQALIEYFRDKATIMVATEAAAEGINLQFCSLVINYDLPWNPQRIEQRIGRCHRYGQKHDVVVINFLNTNNAVDRRVYELLQYKFNLFNGVFGASDGILGTLEGGLDFEKKLTAIFATCRTKEEIDTAFTELQNSLKDVIESKMEDAHRKLLDNFDEDVQKRLKLYRNENEISKNIMLDALWKVTKYILSGNGYYFNDSTRVFGTIEEEVLTGIPPSYSKASFLYKLGKENKDNLTTRKNLLKSTLYSFNTPLAISVLKQAKELNTPNGHIKFNYTKYGKLVSVVKDMLGKIGYLQAVEIQMKSKESGSKVFLVGVDSNGKEIPQETLDKLINMPATYGGEPIGENKNIDSVRAKRNKDYKKDSEEQYAKYLQEEEDKLDNWADDRRTALKLKLNEMEKEIKALRKENRDAIGLEDKLVIRKKLRTKEKEHDKAWKDYETEARAIEKEKDKLIDSIENQLKIELSEHILFSVSFEVL